jgi:hypothetical protein
MREKGTQAQARVLASAMPFTTCSNIPKQQRITTWSDSKTKKEQKETKRFLKPNCYTESTTH